MILILLSREYRSTLVYCLLMIRLQEDVKQTWLSLSPGQGEISLWKERHVFTTNFFLKKLEDRKWCDHGMCPVKFTFILIGRTSYSMSMYHAKSLKGC